MRGLIGIAVILMAGCGGGKGGSGDGPAGDSGPAAQQYAMTIEDAASLPACDGESKSRLIYQLDEQKFKACDGAAWQVVEIKGEKGDKGDAGEKGAAGADGISVTTNLVCPLSSDLDASASGSVKAVAHATIFSTGDIFLNCSGYEIDSNYTYTDWQSNSDFWAADSNGVKAGSITCLMGSTKVIFEIGTKKATYILTSDELRKQTVQCE